MTSLSQKYINLGDQQICHWHFNTIKSTQDFAREIALSGTSPFYITTDHQTHGRGQGSKTWLSSPNQNICMTLCLPLPCLPTGILISHICCLIGQEIEQILGKTLEIKWPNDLMYQHKKLGGILVETYKKNLLIGIGINVLQTQFNIQASYHATSLSLIADKDYSLRNIELRIARAIYTSDFNIHHIPNGYYKRLIGFLQPVSILYKDTLLNVRIERISTDGLIVFKTDNTSLNLHHGEFQFMI